MNTRPMRTDAPRLAMVLLALASSAGCWQLLPATCETTDNCPAGFVCQFTQCVETTTPGADGGVTIDCIDNADCASGACVEYVCLSPEEAGLVVEGTVYVTELSQWEDLQTVTTINGSLYIGSSDGSSSPEELFIVLSGDVTLPSLRRVNGGVHVYGQRNLTSISFPLLKTIDGEVELLYLDELKSVSLPVFADIPDMQYGPNFGEVTIEDTPKLELLSAPALTKIGWISLEPGPYDPTSTTPPLVIDMPLLTQVAYLDVGEAGHMKRLHLPMLTTIVNRLYVRFPDGLEELSLPALERVEEEFDIYRASTLTTVDFGALESVVAMSIDDNDALTSLHLPSLTTVLQGITITGHAVLTTLDMPALTSVNNVFNVSSNPQLDVCAVQQIVEACSPGGDVTIDGNLGDVEACP